MFGKKGRSLICFILGLSLLFYAVPRLPIQSISQKAMGFSLIWVLFALLVVGANLHHVLGLDYKERLEKRKRNLRKRKKGLEVRRRRKGKGIIGNTE